MPVSADFTLDTVNQIIKHTAGTTVYTSNQLYSQIQDWMDDALYMDFTPPMSAQTPTDYQIINGWFLDENTIEWLQGGAITTNGYNNVIYKLTFGATYTAAVATDIGKTVQNTGATHTGLLLDYDNTNKFWWIRAVTSVFTAEAVTISGGTGTGTMTAVATGEMAFPNIYTLGTIDTTGSPQIYVVQNNLHIKIWGASSNADPTPNGSTSHIDVLVKTKDFGTAIDSGNLTLFLRNYPAAGGSSTDLYDNFSLTALTGRNAVPLATSADLNNTTAQATVSGYNNIKIVWVNGTITHGAITGTFTALESVSQATSGATGVFINENSGTMTLGNVTGTFDNTHVITGGSSGATATSTGTLTLNDSTRVFGEAFTQDVSHNYSVIIDCASRVLTQVYEYLKYYTRQGATGASFQTYEVEKTGASTWIIDKLDGEQYITAFEDFNVTTNSFAPVKPSPFGTFAGGKLFGARGVWLQNMAASDVRNYQLIDSGGTTRTPPNQQSLTITNLVSGDAVSVFQTTGGTSINKTQFTNTVQSSGASTIVISTTIPQDTPTTGYIRVVQASNSAEQRYYYSSWSGSTFTLAAHTDGFGTVLSATTTQSYTASDHSYIPFIDDKYSTTSASVTVIYVSDRTILVRVRRYNSTVDSILPFETTGTFTSTGYSTPAIRTSDTIVT